MIQYLQVSAPGRICLFGEHQDYLQLPVIAAAISLRITITGHARTDKQIHFQLPDINDSETIQLQPEIPYQKERDYFRSALNVLQRQGLAITHGFDCEVRSTIPINSGTSSSSALIVAWVKFLLTAFEHPAANDAEFIARMAHQAEVVEFDEPGGQMDHYATSYGDVLFIDFRDSQMARKLPCKLGKFVLGDSLEPKDTKGILAKVKGGMLKILDRHKPEISWENLPKVSLQICDKLRPQLSADEFRLLEGFLRNRDITRQALCLLQNSEVDHIALGNLLNLHQKILRENLQISTPKIDRMLQTALDCGALGGKILGSGGGGCMFVYSPFEQHRVAKAITEIGGKAYVVEIDEGVKVDSFSTR
ncbi:GHMP kinase [bacterium]|nr:GHMP kinase [bacterium]